jgi:subtilisin family serine protease
VIKKRIFFIFSLFLLYVLIFNDLVFAAVDRKKTQEIFTNYRLLETRKNKKHQPRTQETPADKVELMVNFSPDELKGEVKLVNSAIRRGLGENRNQEIWLVEAEQSTEIIERLESSSQVKNVFDTQLFDWELVNLGNYFNDPYLDLQWGMDLVKLEPAAAELENWQGDFSKVTILVVDSGVWGEHEDFAGMVTERIFCDSTGCQEGDDSYFGEHGTHVAGIAGATVDNGKGVISLNLRNKFDLVSIRVFDSLGRSTGSVNALDYILNNYSDQSRVIINLSLGSCYDSPDISEAEKQEFIDFLQTKFNQLWQAGMLPVAAAGNCGDEPDQATCYTTNSKFYPATLDNVVSVGSLGPEGEKSIFSQYGEWVDITAPGGDQIQCQNLLTEEEVNEWINNCNYGAVDSARCEQLREKIEDYERCFLEKGILSLIPPIAANGYTENDYMAYNGTSQAAPLVSGMAGLLWSIDPSMSNHEVRQLIFDTAEEISHTGDYWKYGQVDIGQAVSQLLGENQPTEAPTPTPTDVIAPTATSGPSLTPSPTIEPSAIPIPTATPTLAPEKERCQQFCDQSSFIKGDADCNGEVNNIDYQIWLKQYDRDIYQKANLTELADFDCSGEVDLSDFELWRRNGVR